MNNDVEKQLNEQAAMFPIRCCQPILIAEEPQKNTAINSGTITLIKLSDDIIGITCSHIIEKYLSRKHEGENPQIEIGKLRINLNNHLVDNNSRLDLATLRFSQEEYTQITEDHDVIGKTLLSKIAMDETQAGKHISIGGFPGSWRKREGQNIIVFDSFSISGCQTSISEQDKIYCRIDNLERWPKAFDNHQHEIPAHPGGLSGGPILLHKFTATGILHWELLGIITDGHFFNDTLVIYGRPASHIQVVDSASNPLKPREEFLLAQKAA